MRSSPRAVLAVVPTLAVVVCLVSCGTIPPQGQPPAPPVRPPGSPPGTPAPGPPPATGPYRLDREPEFDIGIATSLDSTTVVPSGSVELSKRTTETVRTERNVSFSLSLALTPDGFRCTWKASDGSAVTMPVARNETLWVAPVGRAGPLGWAGKTWRGRFKVFVNPRGTLTVATRVPLETYLKGVVPGEIGALSEALLQAGRAQAIAARSYSLFYRGRRGEEGFDLYGTVEDQVYGPIESERGLANRVVDGTRGQVALHDENPIRANYCSTCGGITADVWEGWPTEPMPYLVGHRDRSGDADHCAGSPVYRWREEWAAADFVATVVRNARAEGLSVPDTVPGELIDVRVEERSRSGRVWRLVVETTSGDVVIPAYRLRWVLRRPGGSNGILRSNLFKIDVRRDRETRRAVAVVASGAGSGHGVGLCQTGALGMARAKATGERILVHYYPGVEIRRLYP